MGLLFKVGLFRNLTSKLCKIFLHFKQWNMRAALGKVEIKDKYDGLLKGSDCRVYGETKALNSFNLLLLFQI